MQTIYLEKSQVPQSIRGDYAGNKFRAEIVNTVYIPSDAGLWGGGSRTVYSAIRLTDGRSVPIPGQSSAPWDTDRKENTIGLKPGFAIVAHSIFRGKDMGLRFFVHPDDAAKLLPHDQSNNLSESEIKFLAIVAKIKSSYRREYFQKAGFSDSKIQETKTRLVELGFLNKSGAITVSGRNIAGNVSPY